MEITHDKPIITFSPTLHPFHFRDSYTNRIIMELDAYFAPGFTISNINATSCYIFIYLIYGTVITVLSLYIAGVSSFST